MTNGITGEPLFYLNDLAGSANVNVSGVLSTDAADEKPVTTYAPMGTINTLKASVAQKWFQFKGGKADSDVYDSTYDGDLIIGTKSVTNTAFTTIPDNAEYNTTLRFHQYNLQDDYLGSLAQQVFGSPEAYTLFENVAELKAAYNTAISAATASSNALMNDINHTTINTVDVSKKLAKTIMGKYPERYELKFGAKIGVNLANIPNGHLGYDTSKTTGKQTTVDWVVYNATAATALRDISHAEVSVTLSDQNTIDDIVMTKEGDGYKFGDELYLVASAGSTTLAFQFIKFASILDVQANTLNHSVNLEDVLYSSTLGQDRMADNASMTFRLFLAGSTTDASVVQRTIPDNVIVGYGAAVDVSCNAGAQFQQMAVTTRGYGYETGNNLEVFKNNAKINHILNADDAKKLNLGVLTHSKATITSDPVYNDGASGAVTSTGGSGGSGGVVTVSTFSNDGTEVDQILVTGTGSGYVVDDVIQITNIANTLQTVDLSLTQFGANLLNGLIELDLLSGSPSIDTRSMRTTDGGVPAKVIAKASNGAVIELDMANNGTVVNSITVRDGVTGAAVTVGDTITFTNDNQLAEHIVLDSTFTDASFVSALNKGEEYVLDSSAALTAALTGGIYFDNASTTDITGSDAGTGATIKVTTTLAGVNGIEPIAKLEVTVAGTGYLTGETITITNNYQTITKELTLEDANLLNGNKELIGNNYTGPVSAGSNAANNRMITTPPIFTDGAFATTSGLVGTGASIRVDTSDANDTALESLTVRIAGSAYAGTGDLIITNPHDTRQRVTLTVDATATDNSVLDIDELNGAADKVLSQMASDIPFLFYGGSSSPVQSVKNGVDNHFSEAVVTITCDGNQSAASGSGSDRGSKIQSITLNSAAKPGTDNTPELYYEKGDRVTFTVNESGVQQDFVDTQQNTFSAATIVYRITIASLTQEQTDVLNGEQVGTCVPLLPGDVLVLKSTISSPPGIVGQTQFEQSFLTQYHLAAE